MRASNQRGRVDAVPEVHAAVEIESSEVVAHGLDEIATRAIDLRVRRIDMVLLGDRKSTRLNSSHVKISYAVFCLKKKKTAGRVENLREAPTQLTHDMLVLDNAT